MWKDSDKKLLNSFIKRFSIIIAIKIVIIFFFFLHTQKKISNFPTEKNEIPQFCFSWNCINLEIAQTPQERELGLMFRENLDENKWMLFIFDWLWKHGMRMRNTLIPLDIIRLTTGYNIVDIISAIPCKEENCPTYKPKENNLWAIEVNSWIAKKINLKIGDTLEMKI